MKKIVSFYIVFLLSTSLSGQKDTLGLFYQSDAWADFKIILFRDATYKILRPAICMTPARSETGMYQITDDTMITFHDHVKTFYGKLVQEQLSLKKDIPDTVSHYKNRWTYSGKVVRYYTDLLTLRYFYEKNRLKTNCILTYKRGRYQQTSCTGYYESGAVKSKGTLYKRFRSGTWIYYSENGAIDRKEKWIAGKLNT